MSAASIFDQSLEDFGRMLNSVLSPSSAIKTPEFLRGRDKQLTEVRQALAMNGRHVFIHGFQGVGKTSLAYTAANLIQSSDRKPIYVQCSPDGTFLELIHDVLKQALPADPTAIKALIERNVSASGGIGRFSLSASLRQSVEQGGLPKPSNVNDAVELICFAAERHSSRPVVIIDEFDHISGSEHTNIDLFIKKLAEVDNLPLKIIMCGVGETLEHLFSAHLSTYRYFHTIKLDRLGLSSCREIISHAAHTMQVEFDDTTTWRIARISDGFPHFVHLMCEKIFWAMFNDDDEDWIGTARVQLEHYRRGTTDATQAANEELRKGYDEAVRKYAKNAEVILWAAADGHELRRKIGDIYVSYMRIMGSNRLLLDMCRQDPDGNPILLTEDQFKARVYNLASTKYGCILRSNGKGWYEFSEKMMRGYARLKAESAGIELYPDHPLVSKQVPIGDYRFRVDA